VSLPTCWGASHEAQGIPKAVYFLPGGNMQAIETHYNGYRYRSRMEARWAIFFDAMNIQWQYELEGYILGNRSYLPDFFLPTVEMYGEVKPKPFNAREKAVAKQLARESGKPVLMLIDVPDFKPYNAYQPDTWKSSEIIIMDYFLVSKFLPKRFPASNFITSLLGYGDNYANAVNEARSARFEYGYTPIRV